MSLFTIKTMKLAWKYFESEWRGFKKDFEVALRDPDVENQQLYLSADINPPVLPNDQKLDDERIYQYALMRYDKALATEKALEDRADRFSKFCVLVMTGLIFGAGQFESLLASLFVLFAAFSLCLSVILALRSQATQSRFSPPSIKSMLEYQPKNKNLGWLACSMHQATVGTDLYNDWVAAVINNCRRLIVLAVLLIFAALLFRFIGEVWFSLFSTDPSVAIEADVAPVAIPSDQTTSSTQQ